MCVLIFVLYWNGSLWSLEFRLLIMKFSNPLPMAS